MTYLKEIINYEKNDVLKRTEYIQNIKGSMISRNTIYGYGKEYVISRKFLLTDDYCRKFPIMKIYSKSEFIT